MEEEGDVERTVSRPVIKDRDSGCRATGRRQWLLGLGWGFQW